MSWRQRRPGLRSTAELTDQGQITLTATGPSPQNEEDALEICARLVRASNSTGAAWCVPVEGIQDIDGYATNAAGAMLEMQVVRASNNGKMWQEINRAGSATVAYDVAAAAGELIGAIRKKAAKYSAKQKKAITLVLDAGRTPSLTFQNVFNAFRREHLEECQKAGFAQVWVVGSHDSLVERLDR